MSKVASSLLVLTVVALPALGDTIVGSKHDLSISGWDAASNWQADNVDQVCIFCHTPHLNQDDNVQWPLWNHRLSSNAAYGVYASEDPDKADLYADIADIGPAEFGSATTSHLCMSCHDGTIGVGSLYNDPNRGLDQSFGVEVVPGKGGSSLPPLSNNTDLGTSLADDHPINFTYPDMWEGLHPRTDEGVAELLDAEGKVQCASCHSSHDPRWVPFLVKSNSKSALCLTCHDEANLDPHIDMRP